jgi:hypothetical protein
MKKIMCIFIVCVISIITVYALTPAPFFLYKPWTETITPVKLDTFVLVDIVKFYDFSINAGTSFNSIGFMLGYNPNILMGSVLVYAGVFYDYLDLFEAKGNEIAFGVGISVKLY